MVNKKLRSQVVNYFLIYKDPDILPKYYPIAIMARLILLPLMLIYWLRKKGD